MGVCIPDHQLPQNLSGDRRRHPEHILGLLRSKTWALHFREFDVIVDERQALMFRCFLADWVAEVEDNLVRILMLNIAKIPMETLIKTRYYGL